MRKLFKVGETYYEAGADGNGSGRSVRIIADDAGILYAGKLTCNLVGVITEKSAIVPTSLSYYDDQGNYAGQSDGSFLKYKLVSNEPTEEELALIRDISDYCERSGSDREEQLLKIIRRLRKK